MRTKPTVCLLGILLALGAGSALSQISNTYVGTARLFASAQVSVIYPTGTGDDARARRSAESRAAYLTSHYGIETAVHPDDDVPEQALRGNLLLLGWENRLLRPPDRAAVLRPAGSDRVFLDTVRVFDGEELMFVAASPYGEGSLLYFWSRIDPVIDRFQVIPFIGSDWVIYDGYRTLQKGRFGDLKNWPPKRDPYAEYSSRGRSELTQVRARSPHYRLHHPDDLLDEQAARRILDSRETAMKAAVERIGDPGPDFVIDLYVFQDSAQKAEWTDVPDPAHGVPGRRQLYMVAGLARATNPHEEIHQLAHALWGPTTSTALYEGLALAREAPDRLAPLAALLVEQQSLPGLEDLLDEERLRRLGRGGPGLSGAALMVAWIDALDEGKTLRSIYGEESVDLDLLASKLERGQDQVEAAFRAWVAQLAEQGQAGYRFERAFGEARDLRSLGRIDEALERITEALQRRPDDPSALYLAVLLFLDSDEPARAEPSLRRLLAMEPEGEAARLVLYAPYQLGQMYEKLERWPEAESAYRQMLLGPDRFGTHQRADESLRRLSRSKEERKTASPEG